MAKLLLTSDGLTSKNLQNTFLSLLDKKSSNISVLMMHTIRKEKDWVYVDKAKKELFDLGISEKNLTLANISEDISAKNFGHSDVFYSCGGNCFYILDRMRKTGFDKFAKNFVHDDGLYLGVSAGSIIMDKSIEVAGWGNDGDENDINLEDFQGLGFINLAIFPHYENKFLRDINSFKQKFNYPIYPLKNGEGLLFIGKEFDKPIKIGNLI